MAESSLSITFSDLQSEVRRFAGWDAVANWTSANTSDFGLILKAGLRKFYFPPAIEPGQPSYEWSFLRVFTTLALTAADFNYTLPDDCSGIIVKESVTFALGISFQRLTKIDESDLRSQQASQSLSGRPTYFAVRPVAHAPATGHRYEMLLYPTPDSAYTLHYGYVVLPNTLDATNIYPYGGGLYSEVILAAVLSEAERLLDDDPNGPHQRKFLELLSAAIRLDKEKKATPENPTGVAA